MLEVVLSNSAPVRILICLINSTKPRREIHHAGALCCVFYFNAAYGSAVTSSFSAAFSALRVHVSKVFSV